MNADQSPPDVSVVLPVFNGAESLARAIESVCIQDVPAMEVILLDDGSKDRSWEIIASYPDSRIRSKRHANVGLAPTLNRGIASSRGRYIARQDQDDLVLPGRFAKQLAFLEENPDVAMVGTWAHIYAGDAPTARYHRHPCSNGALQLELLFNNSFVHSSVMIRVAVLREVGGYCEDKSLQPPEDYELWSRIARRYLVANLPEVLTVYREVPGSMSRAIDSPFLKNVIRISSENLHGLLAARYESNDCRLLAELYHHADIEGSRLHLSKSRAREMLEFAAQKIGGERLAWSDEFLASYRRIRTQLDSRFLQRKIPAAFIRPAKWLRNRLLALRDKW